MAGSIIGLDIGTAAVRAAEVASGRGGPVLLKFAQVGLPPGAVVAGEVVDAAAVGAALKRLWKEGGFKKRKVVACVGGQRVVARTTEIPAMSDADIRSSLPFQVQELIPIPIEEAVIDYQVLEPFVGDDGSERLRVLVVAAHRDMVRSLVAALESAGLTASRVDLDSFALLRSLYEGGFAELEQDGGGAVAEAIVDIGGGLTNVVVHEHGVPRFIRSLATGGAELTDALVTDLGVDFDEAEALKRGYPGGVAVEHVQQVTVAAMVPVLEEVRSSLDYWQAQAGEGELRRVQLVGGGARTGDFADRLERVLGVPVVHGRALDRVKTDKSDLDVATLDVAADVAAVAIGLALSGEDLVEGSRRISLLPGEIMERRRERQQVLLTAAGVAAFAVLLLGLYLLRSSKVSEAEDRAALEEARTTQLQADIASLQDVELLEADLATRRQTVTTVLQGDVAWTRLILEIATVLPHDVWLTTFNATRGGALGEPGQVSVGAMGFDHTSTARWIIRVSGLEALDLLWVPSSSKSESEGQSIVTFSSSASLTPMAQSNRVERFLGDQP